MVLVMHVEMRFKNRAVYHFDLYRFDSIIILIPYKLILLERTSAYIYRVIVRLILFPFFDNCEG